MDGIMTHPRGGGEHSGTILYRHMYRHKKMSSNKRPSEIAKVKGEGPQGEFPNQNHTPGTHTAMHQLTETTTLSSR